MLDPMRAPNEHELRRAIAACATSEVDSAAFHDLCRSLIGYVLQHKDSDGFPEVIRNALNAHYLPEARRKAYAPVIGYYYGKHKKRLKSTPHGTGAKKNDRAKKPQPPGPQGILDV